MLFFARSRELAGVEDAVLELDDGVGSERFREELLNKVRTYVS